MELIIKVDLKAVWFECVDSVEPDQEGAVLSTASEPADPIEDTELPCRLCDYKFPVITLPQYSLRHEQRDVYSV